MCKAIHIYIYIQNFKKTWHIRTSGGAQALYAFARAGARLHQVPYGQQPALVPSLCARKAIGRLGIGGNAMMPNCHLDIGTNGLDGVQEVGRRSA